MIICALVLFSQMARATPPKVNADLKQFFTASFPYDSLILPPEPYGQAFVDGRLKMVWSPTKTFRFEGHHVVTIGTLMPQTQLARELQLMGFEQSEEDSASPFMTGVGLQAPQAVDLSWQGDKDSELMMQGRTDRLFVRSRFGRVDITLGRQAVGLGNGLMFNPMDLVQPFSFATIDSEYKPGVDAFRLDAFLGMSTQLSSIVSYAGDWDRSGMIGIFYAKKTVGPVDLSTLLGSVRSDGVLGLGISSSVGAVGIHSDWTLTIPEEEDPFVRGVVGVFARPLERSTLTSELYIQTLGAESTEDYLDFLSSDRYGRGELWLMGRYYGALSWSQEFSPLITANIATTVNIEDGSLFVSPSSSISVSDEVQIALGGFVGIGDRPISPELIDLITGVDIETPSEFGLYPSMFFVQMRAYF
jgi:hypothetical protein